MDSRIAGLVLVALLLGACASPERFRRQMDDHLGWDVERLREHFGYNYVEREIGAGQRALTWSWSDRQVTPGHVTPDVVHTYRSETGATGVFVSPGSYFPPGEFEYRCEFTFILDAEGRAVDWRAQGNGCIHYPGPGAVLRHEGVPVGEREPTR